MKWKRKKETMCVECPESNLLWARYYQYFAFSLLATLQSGHFHAYSYFTDEETDIEWG